MKLILPILLIFAGVGIYKYYKKYKQLQKIFSDNNYLELFDFLNQHISDKKLLGKIIHNDNFTQIITKRNSDTSFRLQIDWEKNEIFITYELIMPMLPFVAFNMYHKGDVYNIHDREWLRNIINSVLEEIDNNNIIN